MNRRIARKVVKAYWAAVWCGTSNWMPYTPTQVRVASRIYMRDWLRTVGGEKGIKEIWMKYTRRTDVISLADLSGEECTGWDSLTGWQGLQSRKGKRELIKPRHDEKDRN